MTQKRYDLMVCLVRKKLLNFIRYAEAYKALKRLRGEPVIAAKELCSIHFELQAERWLFNPQAGGLENEPDNDNPFEPELDRTGYFRRLLNIWEVKRNRRAAISAMIVMLSQQQVPLHASLVPAI